MDILGAQALTSEASMARKKSEARKVIAAREEKAVRHARIELPDDDYQRLRAAADRYHLPVAAYIRMAVMERIGRDEKEGGR